MSLTLFQTGTVVDARQINANYYFGWKADTTTAARLPMSGTSLIAVDNAYDIGISGTAWNNVFCNNIEINNSISANGNLWILLAESEVTASLTTSIEFTGLTGDTDKQYKIDMYLVDSAQTTILLYFNNDSGTNYGFQKITYASTAAASLRNSATSITLINTTRYTSTCINSAAWGLIMAKSGIERTMIINEINSFASTTVCQGIDSFYIWSNTTAEITSLKFVSSVAEGMATGTTIKIWRRG